MTNIRYDEWLTLRYERNEMAETEENKKFQIEIFTAS